MDMVKAARESVDLINSRINDWTLDVGMIMKLTRDIQPEHLEEMVVQMEADANPQGGAFSEGKLGRWLGWIQCAGTAIGVLTLEECKAINKKWSD